jgi:hypothetical protein
MAGGRRIKFQDTRIQFLTGWSGDSPSDLISAVTRADPAVVSIANHGRSDGDLIRILGATGMTELNDTPFLVDKLTSGTYSLIGVDSTDYGAYTGNGRTDLAQFSTLCELTGFNNQGGQSPEIPAVSQCSTAAEFEIGLPDFGTVQIDFNYAPQVTVQQAIDAGIGRVQQKSKQGQVGGLWTGSFTMRLTGQTYTFGV